MIEVTRAQLRQLGLLAERMPRASYTARIETTNLKGGTVIAVVLVDPESSERTILIDRHGNRSELSI